MFTTIVLLFSIASKLMTGLIIKSYKSLNGFFKWKFEHLTYVVNESVSKRSKCSRRANVARKSDASKYKIRHKVGFEDFLCLGAARKVKEVKIDDAGHETDDIGPIQTLTTSLAETNEASLAFWLSTFVGEVANSNVNRYPARTLYCIVCTDNSRENPVTPVLHPKYQQYGSVKIVCYHKKLSSKLYGENCRLHY